MKAFWVVLLLTVSAFGTDLEDFVRKMPEAPSNLEEHRKTVSMYRHYAKWAEDFGKTNDPAITRYKVEAARFNAHQYLILTGKVFELKFIDLPKLREQSDLLEKLNAAIIQQKAEQAHKEAVQQREAEAQTDAIDSLENRIRRMQNELSDFKRQYEIDESRRKSRPYAPGQK